VKAHKDNFKKCQVNFSEGKKLATCREERCKLEASISAEIEMWWKNTKHHVLPVPWRRP
jgi:hypothetical protein